MGSLTPLYQLLICCHVHSLYSYQLLQSLLVEPNFEENQRDMRKVLESISKRMIKEQNEGFALKVHYLSYLIQQSCDQGMKTLMKRWGCLPSVMISQQ